eukprot:465905-Lingulodinium_polyedra.AAC.1
MSEEGQGRPIQHRTPTRGPIPRRRPGRAMKPWAKRQATSTLPQARYLAGAGGQQKGRLAN